MSFRPGLQRNVEKMQALIASAPKHPLYDIVVNLDAMEEHRFTGEIIIGWRGKVQWHPEEYRQRSMVALDHYRLAPANQWPVGDLVPPPVWGNDINVSVFVFEEEPEAVFAQLRKMLDFNFLQSLTDVNFVARGWVWTKDARFA